MEVERLNGMTLDQMFNLIKSGLITSYQDYKLVYNVAVEKIIFADYEDYDIIFFTKLEAFVLEVS